jgi:hypothetical protein
MFDTCIFDKHITLCHCSEPDERADLNHVGPNAMLSTSQIIHAFDDQHITSNTFDLCAHAVEHFAELL